MIKVRKNAGEGKRAVAQKHPLQITALLYLKEALLKEQYEVCADIIETAKEYGATESQVRYLLEDTRRTPF